MMHKILIKVMDILYECADHVKDSFYALTPA